MCLLIIYLIRHGKTKEDSDGLRQSFHAPLHSDSITFLEAKKDLEDIEFNRVYSSPQRRAQQTAEILFPGYALETLDFIYEYSGPKSLMGKTYAEGIQFWKEHDKERYDPNWIPDGGESFNDVTDRVRLLTKFLSDNHIDKDRVAIVGHGTFFQHFLGVVLTGDNYQTNMFFDLLRFVKILNGTFIKIDYNLKEKRGYLLEIKN